MTAMKLLEIATLAMDNRSEGVENHSMYSHGPEGHLVPFLYARKSSQEQEPVKAQHS
jgi:hypothetical protein